VKKKKHARMRYRERGRERDPTKTINKLSQTYRSDDARKKHSNGGFFKNR
jgi:hypothetical protein